MDRAGGEIRFGPAVRQPDGAVRQYGAVPPKRRAGPGPGVPHRWRPARQRRPRDALTVLRDPVPFVADGRATAAPATGGVDGESLAEATVRGPLALRTRDRAVTAEDYEQLAREAAPEVARVRCVPARRRDRRRCGCWSCRPPCTGRRRARLRFARPGARRGDAATGSRRYLDERRCVGARVLVEPPFYQGVTVVARLRARPRDDRPRRCAAGRCGRSTGYLNPLARRARRHRLAVRPAGPVRRDVRRAAAGRRAWTSSRTCGCSPPTRSPGERGEAVQRIDLTANALVFSYDHQVRVST